MVLGCDSSMEMSWVRRKYLILFGHDNVVLLLRVEYADGVCEYALERTGMLFQLRVVFLRP